MNYKLLCGDVLEMLRTLPDKSVHCCCTSPPYLGLRDYGLPKTKWPAVSYSPMAGLPTIEVEEWEGCLGLEPTPEMFIGHLVLVYRQVWRVLRGDGTAWVNMGDSYNGSGGSTTTKAFGKPVTRGEGRFTCQARHVGSLKPKDLMMIPARLALALQADGWYLRSDICWSKCLSGGVRIYAQTQKGVMPMTIKDMVRLKPETVKLWDGQKWNQVLSWSETPRPDNPIQLNLRNGEHIGCTPNHLWPTQRGMVRADELVVGDVIQSTTLPEPIVPDEPELIPDDIGWFVGLYLAEGSRHEGAISIAGHSKERGRMKRCEKIAKAYHGQCSWYQYSENRATINMHGPILNAILDKYLEGKTAKDKHLSTACWQRNNNFLCNLLLGYLFGDGHYDKKNDRWRLGFTYNPALRDDLYTICARLGIHVRIKPHTATMGDRQFPAFKGEIRFNDSTHGSAKADTEIVAIGRSNARKFWDITLAEEPHLFALASGVLSHNSNPMPESVTDRPTKAHEYVYLLAKSQRYFYDAEAIKEPMAEASAGGKKNEQLKETDKPTAVVGMRDVTNGRNKRDVWHIPTRPFPEAHFAVFPPKLIEPMILAGTSEKGCCSKCGAPYKRVIERTGAVHKREPAHTPNGGAKVDSTGWQPATRPTNQWQPTCQCSADIVPCTVLDPFNGSGTTGVVCMAHGRNYIGIDLNPEYIAMSERRLAEAKCKYEMWH